MGATMRDVAQRAGVSIKTVSRVVNGQGEISEATRKRVLDAIRDLDFRPNVLARGLVSGKTLSVGLIIPQITDPFFPEVVLGVESVARAQHYNVFLCNTNDDPQQELDYVDALAAKQVDGIILCGSRLSEEDLGRVAAQHPVSMLTSRRPRSAAVVSIRGEEGMSAATAHLIRLGHRAIGHIGWPPQGLNERAEGYRRALRQHGLPFEERWLVFVPRSSVEAGRFAARRLLAQAPEITAITCYNDLVAIGALQACAELGRRVPDDVAVTGFDDVPMSSLVTPALTTMRVPRYDLGRMVMELLLRVIASGGRHEEHLYVQPELVVRQTCGEGRRRDQGPS